MATQSRVLLPVLLLACGLLAGLALSPPTGAEEQQHGQRDEDQDHRDNGRHKGQERREERRDDRPAREWAERHDRDARPPVGVVERAHDSGHRPWRSHWGDDWDDDYGVLSTGRCNTRAVLGVMGAVTGGLIANQAASGRDRGVATILGALTGGLLGTAVGSAIDDSDRACIGQSLELVPFGRPVVWVNPRTHVSWRVVPIRDVSDRCREFDLYRSRGHERVVACRRGRGDWEFDRR